MQHLFLLLLMVTLSGTLSAQQTVKVWQEPLTLPNYQIKAPDKNPMFFRHQSYQGASRYIYPYALEDNLTNEKVEKTYMALYLENEYIKLCVLPEIGGRLFYATDKTNGYEIFYRQHVIKPANIGMLGAWISGGIEFCVFHHHRASTNLPVDYKLVQNPDGSATIWIGETEPRHRMKWSIGISLFPGKSYIEVDGRLINPTADVNSILYWANVATHVNEDYQIFFPPSTDFTVYHAKNSFAHWPITSNTYNGKTHYQNNIDASWWKNHPDPISMFAHNIQDGFLAGYDHGKKAGTMHVGNHHIVKGAKLWEWGPGAYGAMWDSKVLTDSDGPYAELMAGAYSDNQPDYSWLKPYELKTFKQYWYPLRETGGAVAANLQATLNLKKTEDGEYLIAVNTTHAIKAASIQLKGPQGTIFNKKIDVSPAAPFAQTIQVQGTRESDLLLQLTDDKGNPIITYQPITKKEKLPLPEPVSPPKAPEEITSTEELYLTGLRIKQFHNARIDAEPYFQEALKRDPLDVRSNTMLGIIRKENFKLDEAAHYFRVALKRLTQNYTRPRNCEPFYHLGVVLKMQGKLEAAYDTLYRAAWDQDFASGAYFHLAQISTGRADYARALEEIRRSLDYNSSNLPALNLQTSILRRLGQKEMALQSMATVLEKDPLNGRAVFEGVILNENEQKELVQLLHNQPESYIELTSAYLNAGLLEEADELLNIAASAKDDGLWDYPSIHYYRGYVASCRNEAAKAQLHFLKGRNAAVDYCFPFRFESINVFKTALNADPSDARAHYYLGNILYDKQPEQAIRHWEKAVALDPEFAIAYRNLGWGYNQTNGDVDKAVSAYERAIQSDKTQARYYYELDKLYEAQGTDLQKRYELLTDNHQYVSQRPDAFLQEIQVMLLYGEAEQAIGYLRAHFFPRQEGVDNLHDIYVDACLSQGIKELQNRQPKKALQYFQLADEYPENHQLARNSSYQRNAQIFYYQAQANAQLNNKEEAQRLWERVADWNVANPRYQFYQALAMGQLGRDQEVLQLAEQIHAAGAQRMAEADEVDFFSKFGEGTSVEARKAEGWYLMGLAARLRGNEKLAGEHFQAAVELYPGHLWARIVL